MHKMDSCSEELRFLARSAEGRNAIDPWREVEAHWLIISNGTNSEMLFAISADEPVSIWRQLNTFCLSGAPISQPAPESERHSNLN